MNTSGKKSNYCEGCGDFHDDTGMYMAEVQIGKQIPDYEFQTYEKDDIALRKFSDYRGKWLIVLFYPADFTFVCPTELEEMAHAYGKVQELGGEVISFSTDTVYTHKAWHDTSEAIRKVQYPMGADPSGKISYAFGVLVEGGELPLAEDEGQARRGTFLIDPQGVLRTMEIHDNSIGRSAKETLRKLEAAVFVEKNPGKVCPASWEPGEEGMEPGMDLVGKI